MDFKEIVPERYRVKYDNAKDCFYILDTWHPQIKNMADLTQDIPDDSPAMKIVTGSEVSAVIGLLTKMGRFDKNIIKHNTNNNIIKKGIYSKRRTFNRDAEEEIKRIIYRILDRRESNDRKY